MCKNLVESLNDDRIAYKAPKCFVRTPHIANAYFARMIDESGVVKFEKIKKAGMGSRIYLVIRTENFRTKKLKAFVKQGKAEVFAKVGAALEVEAEGKRISEIEIEVGAWAKNSVAKNKKNFLDYAIVSVGIFQKDYAKNKVWYDKLLANPSLTSNLYIEIDAHSGNSGIKGNLFTYYGIDGNNLSKLNNVWYAKDGEWFEIKPKNQCPVQPQKRSHFVIHCTAVNMSIKAIKNGTNYNSTSKKKRNKTHAFVQKDGSVLMIWPLTEKNVWGTKIESKKNLKGQMFHIELNYDSPSVPTEAQYQTLADLFIESSDIEGCWPIIVPHIEVDRGIKGGHNDPPDFNYNHFYSILKNRGVPEGLKKFDHDRYWGKPRYKVPWDTDKTSWPPVLSGDPHKK